MTKDYLIISIIFSFSINDVQEKNEFFWRYQRYELICDYFQKPLFAYPPLSFLAYIGWLIYVFVFHGTTFRVFSKYHERIICVLLFHVGVFRTSV